MTNLFSDINWVGFNETNLHRLIVSLALVAGLAILNIVIRAIVGAIPADKFSGAKFWSRQIIGLAISLVLVLGLASIWINKPENITAAIGMVTAGLAFALQRVITSIAGYFIILRGKAFTVGDRISMGGVRGDVIDLGFMQTTIFEMGQPKENDVTWVKGRQFTGRIVTVANSQIFEQPIYNYTRDFPLIWDEVTFVLPFEANRERCERIVLDSARKVADPHNLLTQKQRDHLRDAYQLESESLEPHVYFKLVSGGVEVTVRFVIGAHEDRETKDRLTREILDRFDAEGIRPK